MIHAILYDEYHLLKINISRFFRYLVIELFNNNDADIIKNAAEPTNMNKSIQLWPK